ncbi:MAG TPA: hypothetical protein VFL69_14010 [Marmoricola sp.]|nr:hypothetical protein [Marmoricola sp.]
MTDVPDEERAAARVERTRVERGVVAAAVADDVLGLHLLDEAGRVGVGDRDGHDAHVGPGPSNHGGTIGRCLTLSRR